MEDFLKIGEITKPQGIHGEVKVKAYVDDFSRFDFLKEVYVGDKPFKVLKTRVIGEDVYIYLNGVADRNSAELLRGKELFVTRDNANPLEEGAFYIVDVLGSDVVLDDGQVIGKVTDITQANVDIYTVVKNNGKILRFPLLKDLLISIDVMAKKVNLKAKRFNEVACYED